MNCTLPKHICTEFAHADLNRTHIIICVNSGFSPGQVEEVKIQANVPKNRSSMKICK